MEAKDHRSPGECRQTLSTLMGAEVYRLSLQRQRGEESRSMGVKEEGGGPIYSHISLPLILIRQSKTILPDGDGRVKMNKAKMSFQARTARLHWICHECECL